MTTSRAPRKALAVVLVLSMSGCASTGTTSPPDARSSVRQSSEDLASLQEGAPPKANDPLVASIERGTIALMPYCKMPPVEIDSIANAALEDLKNHGIKESAPHVLSELLAFYTHADALTRKTTCAQASAVYLTLREGHGGTPTQASPTTNASPSPQELNERKLSQRLHAVEARQAQEHKAQEYKEYEHESQEGEQETNQQIEQENHESEKATTEEQNKESVENCARLSQEAAGPSKYCQHVLEGRAE